jgi:hypothetical protein
VKRTLYRRAEKSKVHIDNPRILPFEYTLTSRGRYSDQADPWFNERWLLYSSPEPRPLLHIFSSEQDIQLLGECHTWIMDGTFKVAPKGFVQLYTIHGFGRFENEAVPCASVLMAGKGQDLYETVFQVIRTRIFQRIGNYGMLRRVLVDFEIAAHNAIRQIFPGVVVTGCLFHFGQTLIKKMHAEGLKTKYLTKFRPCIW